MKNNHLMILIVILISSSCFRRHASEENLPPRVTPEDFPLDSLVKNYSYSDIINHYSCAYDPNDNEKYRKLLYGAWIETAYGTIPEGEIACVSVGMTHGPDMPRMYCNFPPRWQTRTGLHIGMTLDSVQLLNGNSFTINIDTAGVYNGDWQNGKLAGTYTDVFFQFDSATTLPDKTITSQALLDRRLHVVVKGLVVWKPEYWPYHLPGARQLPRDHMSFAPSLRQLTDNDVKDKDWYTLSVMRYEIYARKGYIFPDRGIRDYFEHTSWYKATNAEMPELSATEKFNINYLLVNERLAAHQENTPMASIIQKLPVIPLPFNIEVSPRTPWVVLPKGMPLPDGSPSGMLEQVWIDGVLADTANFYAVLWQGPSGTSTEDYTFVEKITTFDKQFNRIATASIQVPHNRQMATHGECWEEADYQSFMNSDFSFKSFYSGDVKCMHDTTTRHQEQTISGKVNEDGTIRIDGNN